MQVRHGAILGKGFPQALVHTVHSTSALIVPMAKLDILEGNLCIMGIK
jgi:hypothetical protein